MIFAGGGGGRQVRGVAMAVVVVVVVLVALLAHGAEARNVAKQRRAYTSRSRACQPQCSQVRPSLRTSCRKACISQDCYASVYGEAGLEEGEVDQADTKYRLCVYAELDAEAKARRAARLA